MKAKVIIKETQNTSRLCKKGDQFYINTDFYEFAKPYGDTKNYLVYLVSEYSHHITEFFLHKECHHICTSAQIQWRRNEFYQVIASSEVVFYSPYLAKIGDNILSKIIKNNLSEIDISIVQISNDRHATYRFEAVDYLKYKTHAQYNKEIDHIRKATEQKISELRKQEQQQIESLKAIPDKNIEIGLKNYNEYSQRDIDLSEFKKMLNENYNTMLMFCFEKSEFQHKEMAEEINIAIC